MSERPVGSLERSLAALTIGPLRAAKARTRALADTYQGDWEQRVHPRVSGMATAAVSSASFDVSFEHPFLYAPQQQQVPFDVPHFTYGFEQTVQTLEVVRFSASIQAWARNESDWITGAIVQVEAQAPNLSPTNLVGIPYAATAHLTFKGYATMAEGDELLI